MCENITINLWNVLPTGFERQGCYKCSQSRFKVLWLGDDVFQYGGDTVRLPPWLYRAPWTADICWKGKLGSICHNCLQRTLDWSDVSLYLSKDCGPGSLIFHCFFRPKMIRSKKRAQRRKQRTKQVPANQVISAVPRGSSWLTSGWRKKLES